MNYRKPEKDITLRASSKSTFLDIVWIIDPNKEEYFYTDRKGDYFVVKLMLTYQGINTDNVTHNNTTSHKINT